VVRKGGSTKKNEEIVNATEYTGLTPGKKLFLNKKTMKTLKRAESKARRAIYFQLGNGDGGTYDFGTSGPKV